MFLIIKFIETEEQNYIILFVILIIIYISSNDDYIGEDKLLPMQFLASSLIGFTKYFLKLCLDSKYFFNQNNYNPI